MKKRTSITDYKAAVVGYVKMGASILEIKQVTGLAAADIEQGIIETKLSVKPSEAAKTKIIVSPVIQALARLLHTLSTDDQRDLPDLIKEGNRALKQHNTAALLALEFGYTSKPRKVTIFKWHSLTTIKSFTRDLRKFSKKWVHIPTQARIQMSGCRFGQIR